MIEASIPQSLRYQKDSRTVNPGAGNTHGWPVPIPIGSDQHLEELELCFRGVAEIKAGGLPVTALERYGLPTCPLDFPDVLRERIEDEAEKEHVTFGFAYGAIVRMDYWKMMAKLQLENVLRSGGEIGQDYQKVDRSRWPNNPDLVGTISCENEIGRRIEVRMADTFDAKNGIDYPRPWECTNIPNDIAGALLTLFADPYTEAGAGHSEDPPGHAANAAESQAAVEECTEADDAVYRENELLGRLLAQGRAASGLHLWFHIRKTYNYVLTDINGIETRL